MPGKPDFLPFFKFDITQISIAETATKSSALPPTTIMPRNTEFKIMTNFEFRGFFSNFFLFLADLLNAKCVIMVYFEALGPGPESAFFPNKKVNLVARKCHYSTPETDFLVPNGLPEPGTYKLTCTLTIKKTPIAGFIEGPTIHIT